MVEDREEYRSVGQVCKVKTAVGGRLRERYDRGCDLGKCKKSETRHKTANPEQNEDFDVA
jgi:hypothetical protein